MSNYAKTYHYKVDKYNNQQASHLADFKGTLNNPSTPKVEESTSGIPPFKTEYFPNYDEWMMLPIQKKYATLKEYSDGTYNINDWLDFHVMISHENLYMQSPSLF